MKVIFQMAKMMQPLMEALIEKLDQVPSDKTLPEINNWLKVNFQPSIVRVNASSLLVHLATHAKVLRSSNAMQEYIQSELYKVSYSCIT